ncbi:ArsR family transcriptional regulator [Alkalibacterium subtropicum]|uniref:ArsR family transcriptional regulator n=1 Tax=Alkalibacterium subtropicum TaxID=753702 RepID=A0A1I1JAU5_9LACT|nr:metalloregulator ArsR/SmtB family transcription factor [Alkalibacterium subtropicum]SFC45707.1 ArsR family transcriptional regulator [Alkalibacterium subtropicum]
MTYEDYAKIAKALSDPKRVKILDMLSCGAMCACDILEHFDFTQPTLSHHIKALTQSGLVTVEKEGTWNHYSIDQDTASQFLQHTQHYLTHTEECVCKEPTEKQANGKQCRTCAG